METRALAPKGVKLIADDLWGRACFTLSARIVRTQFHGQTKEKLTTRHAAKLLELCVRDAFELWLNEHPDDGRKIVELAIEQALARLSKGKKVERKKSSGIATLPGKLVDCASGDVLAQRAIPGGRRFRGRLGEGSARQGDAGDAAAARQGAQHHVEGQPHRARQQGAAGDRHRDRRRPARRGRQPRSLRHSLRQGHRHDRRRRRRRPHPGAAAHVLLHARAAGSSRPATSTSRSRRCTRSKFRRRARASRRGASTASTTTSSRKCLAQLKKEKVKEGSLGDLALQGPGRDEPRAALGNDDESRTRGAWCACSLDTAKKFARCARRSRC